MALVMQEGTPGRAFNITRQHKTQRANPDNQADSPPSYMVDLPVRTGLSVDG